VPYTPRPTNEILRDMLARVVVRTELTDVHEGSVLYTLCATVAEQIAESDVRLAQIRDQFTFDGASGVDLDERVEELGMTRLAATTATGELTLTRTDTTAALTVAAGATFGRTDSDATYISTADVTLSIGTASATVPVSAQVSGTAGNAPSGSINTILSANGIDSIAQATPLSNGAEAETDSALRTRARRYMNSLARCQPSAIEYQALSFTASDNTRATVATVYEDPTRYGRVELLIDDGNGIGDRAIDEITVAGAGVSQYVSMGNTTIGIERGIATSPTVTKRDLTQIPLPNPITMVEGTDYEIDYGRGTLTLLGGAGLGLTINVSSYRVYTGLVAELQAHMEGTAGDVTTGFRPAGVSLRVLPAPVQRVDVDLLIVAADGANITTVTQQSESAVTDYLSSLGAGEPAYIARMVDVVMSIDDVVNVTVYRRNTNDLASDFYPQTPRYILRAQNIRAITSTTGG